MQAPGDNSITVGDSHVQTYADNNLNEKNLGTQYIYTTEGQLIPTTAEQISTAMDINSQQSTPYMIDQTTYIAASTQEVVQTEGQEVFSSPVVTEETTESTTYVYETPQEQGSYVTEQPVATETEFISEYATDNDQQNTQEVVDANEDKVDPVTGKLSSVSENVEETPDTVEPVNSKEDVPEQVSQKIDENVTENEKSKNVENVETNVVKQDVEVTADPTLETSDTQDEQVVNIPVEKPVVEKVSSLAQSSKIKEKLVQEEIIEEQNELIPDETESADLLEAAVEEDDLQHLEDDQIVAEVSSVTKSINSTATSTDKIPRPRGRRPKTDIPLHILGHDVNNPMENIVNGKTPKPRLGVKVPYRNLTSQIVSKAELEKEIVERGRKKHEGKKDEVMFARQLTSRLAKRLVGETSSGTSKSSTKKGKPMSEVEFLVVQVEVDGNDNEESQDETQKETIDNNSDLLAILEGEDDGEELPLAPKDPEPKPKESTPTDETNIKNLEREIALQQLQDLPYLSPSTRFTKKQCKPFLKELPPSLSDGKTAKLQIGKTGSTSSKQNSAKEAKEKTIIKGSPVKQSPEKMAMEIEPQIKVNMALKTYSRKRKSSDSVTESVISPSPSKKTTTVVVNTVDIDLKPPAPPTGNVYVTKSSRIIKKKVIWDPDESIPFRLTSIKPPSAKVDSPVPSKPTPKPVQSKNENRSADLPKKSAETKPKTEKKVEEKLSPKKETKTVIDRRTSPGSKTTPKPKKGKSEVDRLLGDEGAIKMLYDLKTSDDHVEEKRRKTVISVEKTFKDLAKKANQIKSDLANTAVESPKTLRKKDPLVSPVTSTKSTPPPSVSVPVVPSGISRQKSKDSSRSTPPPSPAFSFPNETSYLIRRRSSSSISSANDTGGSLDLDDVDDRSSRKKAAGSALADPLKIKRSKKNSESRESERSQKRAESRIGHYNTFSFKKINKSITIDLYSKENKGCYFTSKLLGDLTAALNKIAKEKDCNVVLIRSSQSGTFSRGLDYKELLSDKEVVRKDKAIELAEQVSNFIQCLLDFPKVLIAGIQGECIGLAVTMLPLFDIVIGSDNASFSTPYSTLGTVAEAGFLLAVPHLASHGLAGELFYASHKLTADEAFRRGLLSKLCWPEKYNDTVKTTLISIAKGSKQSLESTKKQLRSSIRESTEEAIDAMSEQLVDHWSSNECQNNFAKIVE